VVSAIAGFQRFRPRPAVAGSRIEASMLKLIEDHLAQIEALCVTHGVRHLDLFGSAARGDFDPQQSDLDFLIEFHDLGWEGSFKRYMGLKLALEDLLGRPVDLVEIDAVTNPYFIRSANRNRLPVYAA
jgi:predicted nucleotidyltransferase